MIGSHSIVSKRVLVSLLFLCFVYLSNEDLFFKDLQNQLTGQISGSLSCGYSLLNKLTLGCAADNQLILLSLSNLKLDSLPSTISLHSQSLKHITINSAGLFSLGDGFCFLKKLNYLHLDSNSLSTLPNELSSLTLLSHLHLGMNPSLEASTDLFKELNLLTYINIFKTLVSGLKLPNVQTFSCDSSCVSSANCRKNTACSCSCFDSVSCSNKGCSWCSDANSCLSFEDFPPCDEFDPINCPSWCFGECGECPLISLSSACVSPCFWCSSSKNCLSSTEECSTVSSESSASSASGSSITLILICVLIPLFVLLCVIGIVVFFFRLNKRRHSTVDKLDAVLATTNITLEDSDSF